jgi:integrase
LSPAYLHEVKIRVHRENPERILNELTECDLTGTETLLGAFEGGDVGACRDQPDDFAIPPLRLEAAMQKLQLTRPVRYFDLELDRLAGEALGDVGLDDREEFVADHLRETFADHMLKRKTEPLHMVVVDAVLTHAVGQPMVLIEAGNLVRRRKRTS